MSYTAKFIETAIQQLKRLEIEQGKNIRLAAERLTDTVISGGKIFIFGCTHAGILAQEAFYRTGGLAIINPILPAALGCDVVPITMTSAMERTDGYAKIILDGSGIKSGDMLIVHSVSGRNNVPVEMAIEAIARGIFCVGITNLEYSRKSKSRHASGKRLFEVCDLVIDDCGVFGDAAIEIEGFSGKVAPTSTVTGAAIINSICAESCALFVEKGVQPPVFVSANIDGGDDYNAKIMEKYKDRITYM